MSPLIFARFTPRVMWTLDVCSWSSNRNVLENTHHSRALSLLPFTFPVQPSLLASFLRGLKRLSCHLNAARFCDVTRTKTQIHVSEGVGDDGTSSLGTLGARGLKMTTIGRQCRFFTLFHVLQRQAKPV
jgi:hypothetical protein